MANEPGNRRRPEDFLELVERSRRGRFKVYMGFAAGVGKTYQMLEEAHQLRKRGVGVTSASSSTPASTSSAPSTFSTSRASTTCSSASPGW